MFSIIYSKKKIDNKLKNEKEGKINLNSNSKNNINNNTHNNCNKDLEHNLKEQLSLNRNGNLDINTDLTESFLYKNKFIRKPVEINFENGFKFSNLSKNLNICNNSPINKNKNNDLNKKEEGDYIKPKTDRKIKPYTFFGKNENTSESELYRNFKELKRKFFEISKRKIRKNLSGKVIDFKKDINLGNVRNFLDNIKNSKSNKNINIKGNNKLKIIKVSNIKDISNNVKLLNNKYVLVNSIKDNKNDFYMKKDLYKNINCQETDSNYDNSKNEEKKSNKDSYSYIRQNSNKIIDSKNNPQNEINTNEKNPKDNKYDININESNLKRIIEIKYNNNNNINYHKIKKKNNKNKNKRSKDKNKSDHKSPLIKKKYKEDFQINSNDKLKNKINACEINNICKKEKIDNLSSIQEESSSKYNKKIIPINLINVMENKEPNKIEFSKEKINEKNAFNVEKQKIILLKRKRFVFLNNNNSKDLIDNLRLILIKYIFDKKRKFLLQE